MLVDKKLAALIDFSRRDGGRGLTIYIDDQGHDLRHCLK